MVRCPKCGKMNQDSSRFCNDCGAVLPQTRIRCPKCGMMNPIGNVFCARCNTRLLSTDMRFPEEDKSSEGAPAGVKGISLPTLSAKEGTPEPAELPDWLLELTEESVAEPAALPGAEEPSPAALPDWLFDMMGEAPVAAEEETGAAEETLAPADLPSWFSGLTEEAPTPAETLAVEDELPDWLAGTAESEQVVPQESPAMTELPDWISDLTPEEPVIEEAPSTRGSEASPAFAPEASAELPDWLRAVADAPAASESQGSSSLPSWLLANADEPSPVEEPGMQELPGWLVQGTEGVSRPARESVKPPTRQPPPFEPEPVRETEPNWLSGILFEEPKPKPALAQPAPSEEAEPDWLSGILLEEPEPTPAQPAPAEEAMPDWLSGILAEEPEPTLAQPASSEEAVPEWLSGILSEEPEPALAQPAPSEEAVPDWLSGIFVDEAEPTAMQSEPPVLEEKTPDWLSALAEEAASPFMEKPGASTAPVVKEPPNWLAGLGAEDGKRPVLSEAAPTVPGEQRAPRAATPDWLKDITPPSEVAAPKMTVPAFVLDEADSAVEDVESALFGESEAPEVTLQEGVMPDWLKGLAPTAPGQPLAEEEIALEDETLVRAEVPAWLQGLRPPGTGPLRPLPEAETKTPEAPGEEGRLARAEIPDWVQELRPAMTAGRVTEKALFPELTETEGPLAGLVGVLPAGLLVDMPTDFEVAPRPAIPESVIAQAQLWQALLEQPRGVKRPVAQQRARSGEGEMATRWIVAIVLIAVTVLGLLLGDTRISQALSKPHIENLDKAIQALHPEDAVIVAVEYGPAEAGEMTPIAEALIEHLRDRDVRITMVSTLPEGAGLAQGLLATPGQTALPSEQAVYLPGSSSGVAIFMSGGLEDAKLLVILTARTERLRWWVEQNNASRSNAPLPMGIGVSASVGPLASPYLETPAVAGWLVGFPDVVAYREFRGSMSDSLSSQLDALMLAHWAALGLLLFGLLYYLVRGKKGAS